MKAYLLGFGDFDLRSDLGVILAESFSEAAAVIGGRLEEECKETVSDFSQILIPRTTALQSTIEDIRETAKLFDENEVAGYHLTELPLIGK